MHIRPSLKDLHKVDLFQGLSDDKLSWLGEHLFKRTVPARKQIAIAGEQGKSVFIILSGTIKIYVQQEWEDDKHQVILAILGSGDTVGEMSLLDSAGRSANVVTIEESVLLEMDADTFWTCLQDPSLSSITYKLFQVMCSRLRLANQQRLLATLDTRHHIACEILAIADRYGLDRGDKGILIPIRLTQRDIAGLIGVSREGVNHAISFYKKKKYISVDKNYHITIHNRAELADYCDEL